MRRAAGRAGFTLIELMMAIVVLTVGLLGLATVMASVTYRQQIGVNRADMLDMANAKLEQLRAAATSRAADTMQLTLGGSLTAAVANHADAVTSPRGRVFLRRWVVTAGPSGVRTVVLRVLPQVDDRKTPAQIDFTTYILIL
jgi:prepilin-type N-terminal cleavage/methylation domain-containing protein